MTTAQSPAKLPREERVELLLAAAREEFGSQGHAGASLGAIAARADVSKALVLSYFGSKDHLYAECVRRAGTNLSERIEKVITAPLGTQEMALATLATIFEGLEGRQQDWNVLNDRTAPDGSVAADAARAQRRAIAEQASRGIQNLGLFTDLDDEDLDLLLNFWMSSVTAVVGWWLRHPERGPAEMATRCRRVLSSISVSPF